MRSLKSLDRPLLAVIVLLTFALYAPAVRLMPFHDDAVLMPAINNRSLITIFENRPFGDGHHRPISYVPWLLTRDLFGWFDAPILHLWNVFAHTLNTALVGMLILRLGATLRQRVGWAPALGALLFGLFPFSYEAVLWSSALVHPLSALLGLLSVHAYLTARNPARHAGRWIAASCGLLLLACLSHEAGFTYAGLIALIEMIGWLVMKQPVRWQRLAPCAIGLVYPFYYRFALTTKWTSGEATQFASSWAGVAGNLAAQSQGVTAPALIWARSLFAGLQPPAMYLALLAGMLTIAAILLFAARLSRHGGYAPVALAGLMWWLIAVIPSAIQSDGYVAAAPRAMYAASIGAAMLWGAALGALLTLQSLSRWLRIALAGAFLLTLARFGGFIHARLDETARLTPALRQIDADLRQSAPDARVLIINSSFTNMAAQPAFVLGREGMPIWEYGVRAGEDFPMWAWPGAISGIVRETRNVLHAASIANRETEFGEPDQQFTRGGRFNYAIFGEPVDDAALRAAILDANLIYRFDYDAPGFRLTPIGKLGRAGDATPEALAQFTSGDAGVTLENAHAFACSPFVYLDLTWSNAHGVTQPAGVFVHLYDRSGQQVAVADRDPIGGYIPLELMPAQTRIQERREIRLPDGITAQDIAEVRLGIYDRVSSKRFDAAGAQDWPAGEAIVPITSGACPAP